MASPPPPQQPTPGSSFYPQNHQLLTQYLLPKNAGWPLPAAAQHFFNEADVYADDPKTLTSFYEPGPARIPVESENWYFFCPVKPGIARDGRKPRIVGGGKGTWKAERGEVVLEPVEGRPVGRLERFTYIPKPKQQGKPEWLMVKFTLDEQVGGGEPRFNLCKIYRSPRFLKALLSAESACKSKASARKRKAADFSPASLSARARKTIKATGDSSTVRRQLVFPWLPAPIPAPNPLTDEAFLGNKADSVTQQLPSPPPPVPLGEEPIFGDEEFWREFNSLGELPDLDQILKFPSAPAPNLRADDVDQLLAAPWLCSMAVAPLPFCSSLNFCNSIAAP